MQSRPQRADATPSQSDEIAAQSDPLALRLVTPGIDAPNYDTIGPGHDLYPTALLAFRWRPSRPAQAAELARALEQGERWPQRPGERHKRQHRALAAADMKGDGSYFDVAEALCVEVDTARRLVKDGRALHGAARDFQPYVEAVGTETQPRALTLAQSMARSPEVATERLAEHAAQMKAQGRPAPGVTESVTTVVEPTT